MSRHPLHEPSRYPWEGLLRGRNGETYHEAISLSVVPFTARLGLRGVFHGTIFEKFPFSLLSSLS